MIEKRLRAPPAGLIEAIDLRHQRLADRRGDRLPLRGAIIARVVEQLTELGAWLRDLFAELDHARPAQHRLAPVARTLEPLRQPHQCRKIARIDPQCTLKRLALARRVAGQTARMRKVAPQTARRRIKRNGLLEQALCLIEILGAQGGEAACIGFLRGQRHADLSMGRPVGWEDYAAPANKG